MDRLMYSTLTARLEHPVLPFKRCRLRASPATGLVGMRENAFLSDFFSCVGFLPLTTESEVRETMVKIMLPDTPRQEPDLGTDDCAEDGRFGALTVGGTFSGISRLPKDPAFCTFWCAVALGALAKGSPNEAVASYARLAREAFEASRPGSTDVDLAKAAAILAYLHSFTGEMEGFHEYLAVSESCLRSSTDQSSTGIHTGLPDLVLHCRWVSNVNNGSIASSWPQDYASPQLSNFHSEGELYQYVARSVRAFDKAILAKAQERFLGAVEAYDDAGWRNLMPEQNIPPTAEVSEAIAAALRAGDSPKFESLQATADRPSIRTGIGGLLINISLVFEKAVRGDLDATLEKLDRSVEVFERFPGLSRCMMESHISHMLLTVLAEMKDSRAREIYERLRTASNSCRSPRSPPIPPLGEWRGISAICGDVQCRTTEALVRSEHMKVCATAPVDLTQDNAGLSPAANVPRGQTPSETCRAGTGDEGVVDLVPIFPTRSRASFSVDVERVERRCGAGGWCCAGTIIDPSISPVCPGSHPEVASDLHCSAVELVARTRCPLWRPAEVDGRQGATAHPEDDEIDEADWLQVAHAMFDAAHQ
ncbi:unnamed protein product [Scytosiphon promiscuus]